MSLRPSPPTFYSASEIDGRGSLSCVCMCLSLGPENHNMSSSSNMRAKVAETLRETLAQLPASSIQLQRDLVCIPSSLPTIEAFKVHTRRHRQIHTYTTTLFLRFSANRSSSLRLYTKRAVPISLDFLTRATFSHSAYLRVRRSRSRSINLIASDIDDDKNLIPSLEDIINV